MGLIFYRRPGWFCLSISLKVVVKMGVKCNHLKAWLGLEKSSQSESLKWLASCFCLLAGSLGSSPCNCSHKVVWMPPWWQMDFPRVNDPREGKLEIKMLLWPNLGIIQNHFYSILSVAKSTHDSKWVSATPRQKYQEKWYIVDHFRS